MQSLSYLKSHRLWVVRDLLIWGTESEAEFNFLGVENIGSDSRLMFGQAAIGGTAQNVNFADLADFRGNNLPESISSPRVLIRPRTRYGAYLVGEESNTSFRIARDSTAPDAVMVDLFIYELGY